MIRFLADENFDNRVLRGIWRENPDADIVRAQDTTIYEASDPEVLEWAASEGRIILSHDFKTMVGYAHQRVADGLPMLGLVVAQKSLPVGLVVENLLTMLGASEMSEWENQVLYLPL